MKKLIFSAAVLASAFFAASCQQEMLDPQAEGTTVTYTVDVPNAIATKAIGDLITDVDKVYFEVYRAAEVGDLTKTPVYEGDRPVTNNVATFDLEFIKDQEFVVLFWAQNSALVKTDQNTDGMYDINDLRAIKLVNPGASNNAAAQVFAGKDTVSDCVSAVNGNVTLIRPVSQINVYTTTESLSFGDVTIGLDGSTMTVAGLYHTFNVADGDAVVSDENKATFVYTEAAVPTVAADNADLTYVAMNYVGFAPQAGATVTVDFTINTSEAVDIVHKVSNVPVKPNYRTNIVGNLISATADYNVSLNDNWADAGKDMEVLADGIVKNINGDYEISTAVGFAYAINKLFADGGTFYIHPGTYDFTGLVVVPQPTKPGAILNVKANEKPVVTRSTPGFEIIGLDVAYLVSEVTEGSQAIFSGLVLPEDTKLVGTNNGVVGISGCSNEETDEPAELVGSGNGTVVNTVSMASVKDINDAIDQGLKLIELTGDITGLTEIFTISSSVTIDGCGHKLTSSAGRAINVSGADGVTIKNLVIECTGERAINIIQNATNVTIDNVTATASNYTVNVATSAPGAVVNIENSTLNGLNTVNVASPEAVVTVDNSTINCNDNNTTVGESYAALCLNKDAVGGKIEVTNSTINVAEGSDSRKAKNGAEDGIITIDGSAEEVSVQVAAITFEGANAYYSFTSLEDAIAYAQEYNRPVTLIRNLTVAEPVTIEEGQTVVLDLNGKTLAAADMNVIKNNGGNLTIKNGTVTRTGDVVGYSVNNASGEIVIDNATIQRGLYTSGSKMTATNANISHEQSSRHAIYAWNCEVTINSGTFHNDNAGNATLMASGSSVVTINGGTFSIADGRSSLGWTSSMIDQNYTAQVLVKGGLFNGGFRINSADTKLTIEGGEFNTNNGSGFTDYQGTKIVKGGKFTDEGAQNWAKKYIAEGFKMNADGEVVEKDYVAQIGNEKYESLQEAFATVQDDQTITFLSDVEQADGVILTDKNITVDLNGKTFTVSEGASTNNRNFKINGSSKVTIKNGTMIAAGELTSGAYGTVRTEDEAVVNLETVKLYSYRGYGLNVKANTGTKVNIKDSEIYSQYSGGVEAAGGEIELTNVKIEQRGVYSGAAWCSVAIGVNGGGKVTVNSGDYNAAAIATDSNAAQATWVAYVMSSGGTLDIKGGTFTGVVAETASAANACGLICADRAAVVNIYDGIFNSNGAILDMRNNVGTQPNPVATLYGGNFSADPRVSGLYSSNLIKVAEGKEVVDGADGRWTIQ